VSVGFFPVEGVGSVFCERVIAASRTCRLFTQLSGARRVQDYKRILMGAVCSLADQGYVVKVYPRQGADPGGGFILPLLALRHPASNQHHAWRQRPPFRPLFAKVAGAPAAPADFVLSDPADAVRRRDMAAY
jgi:hypothetical protein